MGDILYILAGIALLVIFIQPWKKNEGESVKQALNRRYRNKFLPYSTLSISLILVLKAVIIVVVFVFICLAKWTNIQYYDDRIFNEYDYRVPMSYKSNLEPELHEEAMIQERTLLERLLTDYTKEDLMYIYSPPDVSYQAVVYAKEMGIELIDDEETVGQRLYTRAYDYHFYRQWDVGLYAAVAIAMSFLTEAWLGARASLARSRERENLYFQKKIMVLHGSLKPVNFDKMMQEMISKATPYNKENLKKVHEALKDISVDSAQVIKKIGREQPDNFSRMFYEKLYLAAEVNMQDAIDSMNAELKYERVDEARAYTNAAKQLELKGVGYSMLMLFVAMLYILIPMYSAVNLSEMSF